MSRSAKVAALKLDTARIPEQPSATMSGTVDKIIPPHPSQPEKAQIAVEGAALGYRDLHIENALTDENGEDVRPEKRAHVEVPSQPDQREPPKLTTIASDAMSDSRPQL